jgi:hypothetical protein
MKNFSDTIGNRTRDLPARNAVPQPTASPRAPQLLHIRYINIQFLHQLQEFTPHHQFQPLNTRI